MPLLRYELVEPYNCLLKYDPSIKIYYEKNIITASKKAFVDLYRRDKRCEKIVFSLKNPAGVIETFVGERKKLDQPFTTDDGTLIEYWNSVQRM